MLFMQPIKLHQMLNAWGVDRDFSLWELRREFGGDDLLWVLVRRKLAVLVIMGSLMSLIATGLLSLVMPVTCGRAALGTAVGLIVGMASCVAIGMVRGVIFGIVLAVAGSTVGTGSGDILYVTGDVGENILFGLLLGSMLGVSFDAARGTNTGTIWGLRKLAAPTAAVSLFAGVSAGTWIGLELDATRGIAAGVALGVSTGVTATVIWTHLPSFAVEALVTLSLSMLGATPRRARWLPYLYHDLIRFPLPGLRRILIDLGTSNPEFARELIDEALISVGQRRLAQRAVVELQAHDLERLARTDAWSRIIGLDGPFFPDIGELEPADPLHTFIGTARDVQAASSGGSQHRRLEQLEKAQRRMESFKLTLAFESEPDGGQVEELVDDAHLEIENDAVDELVRVFFSREDAIPLALEAGYPRSALPRFSSPLAFWSIVIDTARNGMLPGGVGPLITAAAARYPGNSVFRRYRGAVRPRSASSTSSPEPARRASRRLDRLGAVAHEWSKLIQKKLGALRAEIAKNPEVPAVFIVGPVFDPKKPADVALFRVRRDLVDIIDRDLDTERRGPLFLTGQRRMGKSSLLRMLPIHLGSTTISSHDFQGLSGSGFASAPHRWLVEQLAAHPDLAARPDISLPDQDTITDVWGTALDWLRRVDDALESANHRVLITIDEIERLQEGAAEDWSTLTFLDFIRAAGDALHRIRLLLVSAHHLTSPRLGPQWADRLISAFSCRLGPLPREEAERLLREPVPYFPSTVFDDKTAAAILAQTGGHPYLIQAVGDKIVRRLNQSTPRRTVATLLDVERALDGALNATAHVFSDLWRDFEEPDVDMLRALAHDRSIDPNTPTFRRLRDLSFVELREDGSPVFVFPLFARWIRDYQS